MSEDFNKKLQDYQDGLLSAEETAELEQELEKLSEYQQAIETFMNVNSAGYTDKSQLSVQFDTKKEAKIISKAKWKARLHNAFTAIGIVFLITFFSGVCTVLFFSAGDPSRASIYNDVVDSTVAITEPNIELRGSATSINLFFTMNLKKELVKQIGSSNSTVGEMNIFFLFNQLGSPERNRLSEEFANAPFYPNQEDMSDWDQLHKLPEGTVAEARIYLNKPYSTQAILDKLKDKEMLPVWFAVDTGIDMAAETVSCPIGFPYQPIWHDNDMILKSHTEQKGTFLGKTVAESYSSPSVESYGSAALRDKNFIDTLKLLQQYANIANKVSPLPIEIANNIEYLDKHGVKIYGIVVTGPSKEILKLSSEPWVSGVKVGEVRLWNWQNISD